MTNLISSMDIIEIYRKLKTNGSWVRPEELKQTRKSVYGLTQVEFAELLGISDYDVL